MKNFRRKFLKLLGFSYLSTVFLPHSFLYSATKKIINPNLTEEQKRIMLDQATEEPFSSPLHFEKRKDFFTVQIVAYTTGMYLMMGPAQPKKDFVIMDYV